MKALLLVDIQNDFLPTGALPLPEGDAVVPVANALLPHFMLAVATQDWHPANHGSFAAEPSGPSAGRDDRTGRPAPAPLAGALRAGCARG